MNFTGDQQPFFVDDQGRTCSKCFIYKEWAEFNKATTGKNGHKPYCRECKKAYDATYTPRRDMDKHRAAMRKYMQRRKAQNNDIPRND